jgi:hypothetical protein
MGKTETRFGELALGDGLASGRRLPWLTNRGHIELAEIDTPGQD